MTISLLLGDCNELLKDMAPDTVDLVVTSPPYADSRKDTYGGVHPDKYVGWFLPISQELFRTLKPTGSFVLNIKERVVAGERHTYVLELIKEMRKQGWRWTEEYIWHKSTCYPGKWPNRFRDAWERCLHFTREPKFAMYQEAVMVDIGDWARVRLPALSAKDKQREASNVGSGFGKNVSNWLGRDKVFPTNVIKLSPETKNQKHSAAFPEALPEWFIKLFTKRGDVVLDPFAGSGTSGVVASRLGRDFIGIEILEQYFLVAAERLSITLPLATSQESEAA